MQARLFGPYFWQPGDAADVPEAVFVGARRFPVQEVYLDDVDSIGTSLGLSEATCSKAKQLITSFGGSPQSEAPSLIRNRQRQLEAMAVSVVVELARAQSCVLVFLPGLAEIQTMSEALETALGRRAKGGLTVVTHVLHSLVPQEEQEAALRVAAPGTVRVPARVAVLRATHSPLVRLSAMVRCDIGLTHPSVSTRALGTLGGPSGLPCFPLSVGCGSGSI